MTISPAARKAGHDATRMPLAQYMTTSASQLIDLALEAAAPVIAAEALPPCPSCGCRTRDDPDRTECGCDEVCNDGPHEPGINVLVAQAAAAERERCSATFRHPVAYLIGLVDGMAKIDGGEDWNRYLACFRQVRDELAVLLPENDGDALKPVTPETTAAVAAAERERLSAEPDGPVAYGQGLLDGQRAERERLAAVIPPADFRKLAGWFDTDDVFAVMTCKCPPGCECGCPGCACEGWGDEDFTFPGDPSPWGGLAAWER